MQLQFIRFTLIFSLFFLTGCEYLQYDNGDKAEYLKNYKALIIEVKNNYEEFTWVEWEKADRRLDLFAHDRFHHFYDDLSFEQKMELGKYPILYNLFKYEYMVDTETRVQLEIGARILRKNLIEIMDSTKHVYHGFDSAIQDILQEFKSRDHGVENQEDN